MTFLRVALIAVAVVALLPTDERRTNELAGIPGATAERQATFCERNPATCAAGRELWSAFLLKAERGINLAASLVRDQIGRPGAAPGGVGIEPAAVPYSQPAARPAPLLEPNGSRGSLTRADLAPQWRGGSDEQGWSR